MSRVLFSFLLGICLFFSYAIADDVAPWDRDDGFYEPTQKEQDPTCYEPCQSTGVGEDKAYKESASDEEKLDGEESVPQEELPSPTSTEEENREQSEAPPFQTLDHVVRRHAEQLTKITRLHWYGAKEINQRLTDHITVAYECYHALTVEQTRKLFVYATETLLKAINSLGPDHPQLGHHPFLPQDIEVVIRFDNYFGQYVDRQYVKLLRMRKGIVEYHSYSCGEEGKKCCKRKERYQDSVDAVKLNLEYADRFQRIKDRRDFGIPIDEAFPFTGVFE